MLLKEKRILVFVSFVFMIIFIFSSAVIGQEKVFNLKVGSQMPAVTPECQCIEYYFDNIAAESNGRINVQYFFAASLVKVGQDLHAVGQGILDASLISPGYTPSDLPLSLGLDIGYVVSDVKAKAKAIEKLYEKSEIYKAEWETNNNKVLFPLPQQTHAFYSTIPLPELESIKDKKFRTYGLVADAISRLGAIPVNIPISDAYEAANRGLVKGIGGIGIVEGDNLKFYETCDYIVDSGYGAYCQPFITMNLDTWNKLPEDLKELFNKWVPEVIEYAAKITMESEKETLIKMVDLGKEIQVWSDSDKKKAADIVQPAQMNEWIKTNYETAGISIEAYKELMATFVNYVEEFEQESDFVSGFEAIKEE